MSLKAAIARLAGRGNKHATLSASHHSDQPIDERPRSAYELVTRRALDDLTRNFDRLEAKVNGLLWGMLAIVLSEIYRAVTS